MCDFFSGKTFEVQISNRSENTTSYASGTSYIKDEVLNIIFTMRDQGATFRVIAAYLNEQGIPTFSGNGEWHAQSIHRLSKKD